MTSAQQHIAVDAMGGDSGPRLCVPATLNFLRLHPDVAITLVGRAEQLTPMLSSAVESTRIRILDAEQEVEMAESAASALRHKRRSSMWRALEMVATGDADACVSAGNTGALMAMARHLIGTIGGMSRPAICKPIPTARGDSYLLDMGANLNCSPVQLLQFAQMGSALAKVHGRSAPTVALLNVGAETTKGHQDIQQASRLLSSHLAIEFAGFIEGHRLYSGDVDVVVCDGFVGNVALKVSEGAASFIIESLRQEFRRSVWRRFVGLVNHMVLKQWRDRFDPSRYNGAALLGLRKTVIKSHGGADVRGFVRALATARQQVQANIPAKLAECLAS